MKQTNVSKKIDRPKKLNEKKLVRLGEFHLIIVLNEYRERG